MAALLALFTFALFIGIDWALSRRRATSPEAAAHGASLPLALPDLEPVGAPVFVGGYELPDAYHYHRGHTWARVLGPDTVAIGVDDFARRLIGKVDKLDLPAVGSWVRQGAQALCARAGDRVAALVAPVEGQVLAVNPALANRPSLCVEDPYGSGWLLKLRSASLASNLRNLMSGRLAQRWTEDAREQLDLRLMALSGSVLADGGQPARDFGAHLDDEEWTRLVGTFLLTGPSAN